MDGELAPVDPVPVEAEQPKKRKLGRPKGYKKSGGRPPGGKNKVTANTKAILESAFELIGGVDALVEWGMENRTEFYKCWSKLIPKDIKLEGGEGLVRLVVVTGVPESQTKTVLPSERAID